MKIKFLKYDRYLCPKCDELKRHKNLNKNKEHQTIVHNQSDYFKQLLDSLSSKQCLIVQDYTAVNEDSQSKIRILNLTIYTKPSTQPDSKFQVQYYDYIGYIKCNYKYTQYIWGLVLEKLHLYQYSEGVFIWSDRAFKNKMNIYYFLQLQKLKICNPLEKSQKLQILMENMVTLFARKEKQPLLRNVFEK
jgi:hypothetical protein